MGSKEKVQAMLDRWSVDELLENGELDLTPFVEFGLEGLGCNTEDDKDDWLDSVMETIESLGIREEDQEVLWNRAAFLLFVGIMPEGTVEGLEDFYAGTEGNLLLLSCMAFIDKLRDREEPDWSVIIRWHLYTRDLLETCWEQNGSPDYAAEMLWQSLEAARIYYGASQFEDSYTTAKNAILFSEDVESPAEGMREALGLLYFYAGEATEDEGEGKRLHEEALRLLDHADVLSDPIDGETEEIVSDLKAELEE